MKKYLIILGLSIMMASCSSTAPSDKANNSQQKKNCKYTCTMHKDVCSDKPGICPKCGMDLVEK